MTDGDDTQTVPTREGRVEAPQAGSPTWPPPEEWLAFQPDHPSTEALVAQDPRLADVSVRDVTVHGRHGPVPCRLYLHREQPPVASLVWVHGGGFVGGDLDMPESHWVGLALSARGFSVLAVDYRKCLGEGTHFPTPSDDVLDAWLWAAEHVVEPGSVSHRLHLGGASAGGNLTAGVTKRLRDGAGPAPASLVLAYALVHPELPPLGDSLREAVDGLEHNYLTPELVRSINLNFTGTEEAFTNPYAFAANGDVAGQPPVYVLNSEADALRSSGEAYAELLVAAGVPVTVEYEPGSQHGHLNEPFTPAGQRSIERIAHWIHGHAGVPGQ